MVWLAASSLATSFTALQVPMAEAASNTAINIAVRFTRVSPGGSGARERALRCAREFVPSLKGLIPIYQFTQRYALGYPEPPLHQPRERQVTPADAKAASAGGPDKIGARRGPRLRGLIRGK